ncbi:MAG: tyrosine-type recombinase/integrase [Clostridiales bacterium]|nr:tyrosine-type recombinase/integrase [Clostridiales bacterium]
MVNLANKRVSFVQEGAKSETSNRKIPISPRAIKLLTELKETSTKEHLFDDGAGERLSYEALRYQCQCACEEANVEYRGLHIWRHTFATNQYYKGTDVKILSKLLGHADTAITYNIYIHLFGDGFNDMLSAVS